MATNFTSEKTEDGVTRREFELSVKGERVPGAIWAPAGARGSRPLILMGHGGSQHKKVANIAASANHYARTFGYAICAIDAPGHGDRVTAEERARFGAEIAARMREGRETGRNIGGETVEMMNARAGQAVPEWQAAFAAVRALEFVGDTGPVGYMGFSMGTALGLPFVAEQPAITCAIFGLYGALPGSVVPPAAARISIPLMFVAQWEDELVTREAYADLFNAFGSSQKTMHINPGGHVGIPAHERDGWALFWKRWLG